MKELNEIAIESDIEMLMKNPLVKVAIGSRCERTDKGSAFIKNGKLYLVLGEDVNTWQETVLKAVNLVDKVKEIHDHNLKHPDLYQRISYKVNGNSGNLDYTN
jgi:hypothetical protein